MSRRKPRFTPDPPPYGASNEQILAWVNAQLQRIEDYWPRDDGDRIAALEELQSKYSGEWSISGQSLIRFEGSTSQEAYGWNCDSFTYEAGTISTTNTAASVSWQKPSTVSGKLYLGVPAAGIYEVDTESLVATRIVDPSGLANDLKSILVYTSGGTEYLAINGSAGVPLNTDFVINALELPGLTGVGQENIGTASVVAFEYGSESKDFIAGPGRPDDRMFFIQKSDLSKRVNYSFDGSPSFQWMWFGTNDFDNNTFYWGELGATSRLLQIRKHTVVASATSSPSATENGVLVAEIDLDDYEPTASWEMGHLNVAFRNGYYWMPIHVTTIGSEKIGFLLIEPDGTVFQSIWIQSGLDWDDIDSSGTTNTFGTQWPYYDESSDCFYWAYSNNICRYSPTDDEVSCCTVEETADWSGNTAALLQTVFIDGDYMYAFDPNILNGGSPFTAGILRINLYGN